MAAPSYKAGVFALTGICGLIDAATFLALGGVFAELMTGNLLLAAFQIGTFTFVMSDVVTYGSAIAAFLCGALLGGWVSYHRDAPGSRIVGYPIEYFCVVLATVLAIWLAPPPISPVRIDSGEEFPILWQRLVIVGLLSFAMGIHNAMMRRRGVPDIATNVMTLTLTGVFSDSRFAGGTNTHWQRRLGSIAVFVVGAALGAWLLQFGVAAPLVAASLIFTAALWPLMKGSSEIWQKTVPAVTGH